MCCGSSIRGDAVATAAWAQCMGAPSGRGQKCASRGGNDVAVRSPGDALTLHGSEAVADVALLQPPQRAMSQSPQSSQDSRLLCNPDPRGPMIRYSCSSGEATTFEQAVTAIQRDISSHNAWPERPMVTIRCDSSLSHNTWMEELVDERNQLTYKLMAERDTASRAGLPIEPLLITLWD